MLITEGARLESFSASSQAGGAAGGLWSRLTLGVGLGNSWWAGGGVGVGEGVQR